MGYEAFIAGWGEWASPGYCDGPLGPKGTLHVGTTAISSVGCTLNGRKGNISIQSGYTPCGTCIASGREGDSGGALCIELGDGSMGVIGITQTGTTAFMAAAHHLITPTGTNYLCTPCHPVPAGCGDMNGDEKEDCDDLDILLQLSPWSVEPFCAGDLNGDGCAGTQEDLDKIFCDRENEFAFEQCFSTCRGDANRDGFVNSTDYNLIAAFLGTEDSLPCPCQTCGDPRENCPLDLDFDGDVDLVDLGLVVGSYQCTNAPECVPSATPCD